MKIALLTLCLMLPGAATAEIYKWTDQQGQVHYGEKAGDDGSETIVLPKHSKQPAAPTHTEKQRLENIRKWNAARQKERNRKKQKSAEQKEQQAEKNKHCNTLKNDLVDMERGGIAWYNLNEAGERVYISEQEIEARKTETRKAIKKNCR